MLLYTAAGPPAAQEQQLQQQAPQLVPGAARLTGAQAAVRAAFFLHVSLLNILTVSSLWARSADVFSPEQAGRLFGLLGAGATLGQLLGSLAARALARARWLRGGTDNPSLLPLLASAAALELAGQAARRFRLPGRSGSGTASPLAVVEVWPEGLPREPSATDLARLGSAKSGSSASAAGGSSSKAKARSGATGSPLDQLLGQTLEGYRLIRCGRAGGVAGWGRVGCCWRPSNPRLHQRKKETNLLDIPPSTRMTVSASPYLLHLCAYLALNYITSSSFYFSKALVVARGERAVRPSATAFILQPGWYCAAERCRQAPQMHRSAPGPCAPPPQCRTPPAALPGLPPSTPPRPCSSCCSSCWPQVRVCVARRQGPPCAIQQCCCGACSAGAALTFGIPLPAGRVLRHLGLPTALSVLPVAAALLMACIALQPAPTTGASRFACGAAQRSACHAIFACTLHLPLIPLVPVPSALPPTHPLQLWWPRWPASCWPTRWRAPPASRCSR